MKTIKTIMLLLALLPIASFAQDDDFCIWTSVEVQKKLSRQLSVGVEGEFRSRDNASEVDRWSLGGDVDYKITKWLKVSAGYTFLYDNNERISYYDATDKKVINGDTWNDGTPIQVGDHKKCGEYWGVRHRFQVSLTGEKKIGYFNFSLRERWQYTYRPEHTVDQRWSYYDEDWDSKEHTYRGKGKNVLRSRLMVEYKRKGQPLVPYAGVEMYNAWSVQKMRYALGVDYKITKQHSLSACYRFQSVHNDDFDNEPDSHIIGLGYKYKF